MKISNISSEASGPVVTKFYVEPSGAERTKSLSEGSRSHDQHGAMPVESISLSDVLLWNQWTQKALKLGMWHQMLDITTLIFYGKVKYGNVLAHKISWKF